MASLKLVVLSLVGFLIALSVAQNSDGRCAYCTGKTCGPDGIGGSCGTCPSGTRCSRGTCICDRGCTGFECGPDHCGTTCGDCLSGQTCVAGLCSGPCSPQCTRPDGSLRTCGWDRCGGCCGKCPDGFRCRDGTCECYPNCENKHCGSDGCGGNCGTCDGGAICQGSTDKYPQQCYFNCLILIKVEVREKKTTNLVVESCRVDVTGPLSFVAPNQLYPGSNPGFFSLDISTGKYGNYTFTTTCSGYQISVETYSVTVTNQLITLHVDWNTVQIEVRDRDDKSLLPSATIAITGAGYSLNVNWVSPIYTWSHGGFMSYSFATSSTGYNSETSTQTVTYNTTLITVYLSKSGIAIVVQECVAKDSVNTATIVVGSTTINYSGGATFTPTSGFTTYTFTTSSPNYLSNTQSISVTSSTKQIVLCVNYQPINFVVTDCSTGTKVDGAAVVASSTVYTTYSLSFTYHSAGTTWTPVGYKGSYSFSISATGYVSQTFSQIVSPTTTLLTYCLPEAPFCGNGVCDWSKNNETGNFASANQCYDCGYLRGIISLAVGQLDLLPNITVKVWGSVNPATLMRAGTPLPTPDFTVVSDAKGAFSVSILSFDAPVANRAQGSYSRRFYFSLSGSTVDKNTQQVTQLLTLWWNYKLTNLNWPGFGSIAGTNVSPTTYFYMTPPFITSDSLVRVILSWGTQISDPSNGIPDLDILCAGPVTSASIALFGTGIVNFQNKDLHATPSAQTTLPFVKLVTDTAQGYGPEVLDFYGDPNTATLDLGFSNSYTNQQANRYEVWVDRPNSAQNAGIIPKGYTIGDTNSFIVVYYNDGTVNQQLLFDALTQVEYAYGFYNGDAWNVIPLSATSWHIIDFAPLANSGSSITSTVVYHGFPGENTTDTSEPAGAKYGYKSPKFETTKQIPCGHTASRGASPAYCPATLTYPATKK